MTFGWVLLVVLGLELKHYIADYVLQASWMIAQKGNLAAPGGYIHAGLHALGSAIVLLIVRVPLAPLLGIVVAEFVVHYLVDFAKVYYGRGVDPDENAQRFWALHGLDQLFHQITYLAMTYFAVLAASAAV